MFEIIEMSEDVKKLLENSNRGRVHSIYKNTINISLDERLIAIHPNNIIKSPMSLRMKSGEVDLESLDLKIGDSVEIYRDLLKLGKYIFGFRNAEEWNPSLWHIDIDFKEKNVKQYQFIKKMLEASIDEGNLKKIVLSLIENQPIEIREDDFFSVKVYSALEGFKLAVEKRDIDKSLNSLFSILGLGIGLTPSGDDFIMGLMSVLLVSKRSSSFIEELLSAIKERLKESLDKTTFLSSELYFYAVEDKYSSIFLDIFDGIKKENKDNLFKSIQVLLAMGHSSGTDTLCGIVFAMNLIDKAIKK
nr:DUF2877 domain-containing protein [Tissierella sp.]